MAVGARLTDRARAKFVADANKRVARGAKWLDKERPNWFRKVRITALQMEQKDTCVLGQVFAADVNNSLEWGYDVASARYALDADSLGFNEGDDFSDGPTFDELQDAWIAAIRTRRKAARSR